MLGVGLPSNFISAISEDFHSMENLPFVDESKKVKQNDKSVRFFKDFV